LLAHSGTRFSGARQLSS